MITHVWLVRGLEFDGGCDDFSDFSLIILHQALHGHNKTDVLQTHGLGRRQAAEICC